MVLCMRQNNFSELENVQILCMLEKFRMCFESAFETYPFVNDFLLNVSIIG